MNKYYEILDLPPNASQEDIKKAWKKKAMEYHPDRNPSEDAKIKMQEINEAYEILTGKKEPPKSNQNPFNNPFGGPFGNPFGNPFGDPFNFKRMARPITLTVELDIQEVFNGVVKKLRYRVDRLCGNCGGSGSTKRSKCGQCGGVGAHVRHDPNMNIQTITMCNSCHGTGEQITEHCGVCAGKGTVDTFEEIEVALPKGVSDGSRMVVTNGGNDLKGAKRGDLFLMIKIKPNHEYEINGLDLKKNEHISFIDMVLGCDVEIQTLSGKYKITIPKHCEANKTFRLKGLGFTDEQLGRVGDLYVKIVPKVPKTITNEEEEILLRLKQSNNFS